MGHFSKEEIEEIVRRLATYGKKDTEFETASDPSDDDIVAIVQDFENKKISLADIRRYFGAPYLPLDGSSQMEGELDMAANRITSVGDPIDENDAANKDYVDGVARELDSEISNINGLVQGIEDVIPSSVDPNTNQLADKAWVSANHYSKSETYTKSEVDQKIQTETAEFKGTYDTWDDVSTNRHDFPGEKVDNNDYIVVLDASGYDSSYKGTWRFKYSGSGSYDKENWLPEYQINEEPLTPSQIAALDSGITASKVTKLDALPTNSELQNTYMPKSGGTFTGDVNIDEGNLYVKGQISVKGGEIRMTDEPTSDDAAINKGYVDTELEKKLQSIVVDFPDSIRTAISEGAALAIETGLTEAQSYTEGELYVEERSKCLFYSVRGASNPNYDTSVFDIGIEVQSDGRVFGWLNGTSWSNFLFNDVTYRPTILVSGYDGKVYVLLPFDEYTPQVVVEGPAMSARIDDLGQDFNMVRDFSDLNCRFLDDDLAAKQDKLVSGTNIKTINNTSLLGSGDIQISADTSDCVKVTSQSFTDAQKAQARANIGAIDSASKDYAQNDPTNGEYIKNRPGGYEETLSDDTISYSGSFDRFGLELDYYLDDDDFVDATGDGVVLLRLLKAGLSVPCTYSPSDGDHSGDTLTGTMYYDFGGEDCVRITPNTVETGTAGEAWSVTPANIQGASEPIDDEITVPLQFPSKYIPKELPSGGTTGQVLTKTADATAWSDVPKEVFVATYGTTTYNTIKTAYEADKVVMMVYDPGFGYRIFYLIEENGDAGYIYFFNYDPEVKKIWFCSVNDSDVWSSVTAFEPEDHSKLRTSWQTTPDDTHYPSEKLVKDSIDAVDKVFLATYNSTTNAQIEAALSAEKLPIVYNSGFWYVYGGADATYHWFNCVYGNVQYRGISIRKSDSQWSYITSGILTTNNRSSAITQNNYNRATSVPSLAALNGSLYKWGVISQTQTWSGTGSNPRTYVMSNLVTGLIPQANIDLFVAAGAEFDTATGYFKLNGLTDISYEEMKVIYDTTIGLVPCRDRTTGMLGTTSPRATLPMRGTTSFASAIAYFAYNMETLEQITFDQFVYNTAANQTIMAFRNCFCLKAIYGYLRLYSTTNDADIFTNCYSLESVNINHLRGSIALKQSSLLSLASVVYMVENAANTSAITITLHASAYARCQADTTEYTYGGQTYTGIIALATAHNITIASA